MVQFSKLHCMYCYFFAMSNAGWLLGTQSLPTCIIYRLWQGRKIRRESHEYGTGNQALLEDVPDFIKEREHVYKERRER